MVTRPGGYYRLNLKDSKATPPRTRSASQRSLKFRLYGGLSPDSVAICCWRCCLGGDDLIVDLQAREVDNAHQLEQNGAKHGPELEVQQVGHKRQ